MIIFMTKEKKEIAFLIGGAAIAAIELIILIVLLIVNAGPKPTPASQVQTASTAVISPRPEKPLPTAPTLPPYPLNDFSPEEFVMVDGRMTYTGGEYLLGIDVSSHQGYIDWKQVKDAGIQIDEDKMKMPGMTLEECAKRTIRAMKRNDLYIITHGEYAPYCRERFDKIMGAFADCPPSPEYDPSKPLPGTREWANGNR